MRIKNTSPYCSYSLCIVELFHASQELSENNTLDAEEFLKEMLRHLPPAKASSIAAKVLSGRRQDYYEMALSLL